MNPAIASDRAAMTATIRTAIRRAWATPLTYQIAA